ncbi:hypothetical protein BU24DRAFT_423350 [Aaosphaeria arxii CBS 175.79]|uniref:Uncharacterized protein n=1 Tax=Aaosphaeria arxii CBS 175.79 TaxID=1450172 RepID=A0A6A5XNS9_9PLEO|nr:uncharacterized protein BU24DRAFT_423350 [Aaosphaeria arxii CBS 175.79]KAF2014390.1 hypothetical protein BU24DRAFT_423350 [Aaosphaeria arxii CBS 175.79]
MSGSWDEPNTVQAQVILTGANNQSETTQHLGHGKETMDPMNPCVADDVQRSEYLLNLKDVGVSLYSTHLHTYAWTFLDYTPQRSFHAHVQWTEDLWHTRHSNDRLIAAMIGPIVPLLFQLVSTLVQAPQHRGLYTFTRYLILI